MNEQHLKMTDLDDDLKNKIRCLVNSEVDSRLVLERVQIDRLMDLDRRVRSNVTVAVDMLNKDGHGWSSRPCQTCSAVTSLLGMDFGCVAYAKMREEQRGKTP